MIEIFEGRLGGGKTYSAVVRIVDHIRRGGLVCTNVEIVWDKVKAYCADKWEVVIEDDQLIKLTDEQIGEFHRHTPSGENGSPVLVVVDEAHLNFNSRDWNQSSRELLAFLTQSRKVHTDVIFISQSQLNMDKQFARLVQYIWRFRDLSKWKIPGLGIAYPFQQILACQFDYDGRTMLTKAFHQKDVAIFGLYNTNSLLREFPRLQGTKAKRKLNKTEKKSNKRMAKYLIIIGLIVGVIAAFLLKEQLSAFGKPKQAASAAPAPFTPAPVAAATPRPVVLSSTQSQDERAKKYQAAYDIYDEGFVSYNGGNRTLKTDSGWYEVGEMSNKGFVVAVSPERARVMQPDGRPGWILAKPVSLQTRIVVGDKTIVDKREEVVVSTLQPEKPKEIPPSGVRLDSGTAYPPKPSKAMEQRKAKAGVPFKAATASIR